MTISELGSLGEFLASMGVFVTLIFLVFQIRQNTKEAKLNSEVNLSGASASAGAALMGGDPHKAYPKALLNPSDLTDEEVMQVWAYMDVLIGGVHRSWVMYSRGLCSYDVWHAAKGGAQSMLSFPAGIAIWSELKKDFPREMTEDIDTYLIDHGTDKLQRQFSAMLDKVRRKT